MKNFNVNSLLKNMTAILCGLIVVALLLPFAAFSASVSSSYVSAEAESEALDGLTFVFGGGILGILFGLMPLLMLAAAYVSQLDAYKKYINLIASALGILLLFLVPGQYSSSESAGYGAASTTTSLSTTYKIGFWIILILYIAQIAIAVIQFFNLKGNKVFDAINAGSESAGESAGAGPSLPNVDLNAAAEKIGNFAKNVTGAISQRMNSNTAEPAQSNPAQTSADTGAAAAAPGEQAPTAQPPQPAAPTLQPAAPTPQPAAPTSQPAAPTPQPAATSSSIALERENSEYIMEQLNRLFEMKEKGILTEEEFAEKKAEFLKKM